jgi:endo-1,4-beta-xylanase
MLTVTVSVLAQDASQPVTQPSRASRRGARGGAPQAPAVVVPPGTSTIILWSNGAPGSESRKNEPEEIRGETIVNVHNPSIIAFLPPREKATGVGLILAPGGGHTSLWIMHEGFNPAQALAEKGIATFVLKNRLQSSGYKFDVEGVADMARAIRVVRSRAAEFGVDPAKIGAGGFSAGGELAELVAIRNDAGDPTATDPVNKFSSRPDFQALIYPGKSQLIQPTANSPPAFMAAGSEDRPDISIGLAQAYLRFRPCT